MVLYQEKKNCCGCSACADVCPAGAICMVSDEEGFRYPEIDREKCIGCGRCRRVCPMKGEGGGKEAGICLGVRAKDGEVRLGSSSGGMFPILARYVLQKGGVVYGAAYNENMEVVHIGVRSMEELENIKKTKYVQSRLDGVYSAVQTDLKEDRTVLFCGTPCQVQALKQFLGRNDCRLLTADLVCYGVPSPGIWKDYVKYLERRQGGRMTAFFFRDKRGKDNGHTCAYVVDGREYAGSLYGDIYCRMYFANHTIRPSCHVCGYCRVERESDFTLGDFWGIEKARPDMDDGMGTSMVILRSKLAEKVWEEVKDSLEWFVCSKEDVLQPRLQRPTEAAGRRGLFMRAYCLLPFPLFLRLFKAALAVGDLKKRLFGQRRRASSKTKQ